MENANMVPNLDSMTVDELRAFWARYNRPVRDEAVDLLGDRRRGYTKIVRDLANYAANKAAAQSERLAGRIPAATMYEGICDSLYSQIPEDLRW